MNELDELVGLSGKEFHLSISSALISEYNEIWKGNQNREIFDKLVTQFYISGNEFKHIFKSELNKRISGPYYREMEKLINFEFNLVKWDRTGNYAYDYQRLITSFNFLLPKFKIRARNSLLKFGVEAKYLDFSVLIKNIFHLMNTVMESFIDDSFFEVLHSHEHSNLNRLVEAFEKTGDKRFLPRPFRKNNLIIEVNNERYFD